MRSWHLLLVASLAPGVAPADTVKVFRWVDENGVVHYSDQPVPGTEPELVDPVPLVDLGVPPTAREAQKTGAAAAGEDSVIPEYAVSFASLKEDSTVWNDARRLPLELTVEPPLEPALGHRIVVYVDGERRAGPTTRNRLVIDGMDRGSHVVQARIIDAAGDVLARTPAITVHHKQHSIPTDN